MSLSSRPRLSINLRQIQDNYRGIVEHIAPARAAAVVKADCYGVGLSFVAPALLEAGCDTFWVAQAQEAVPLRAMAPQAAIYVLSGPTSDNLDDFLSLRLRPVINSTTQMDFWIEATQGKTAEPVALHFETGLNRLAIRTHETQAVVDAWANGRLNVALIMSHLACDGTPDHPMNHAQLTRFKDIKKLFPGLAASLSASYGLYLKDRSFLQDMVRPGRALYGMKAPNENRYLTRPALRLSAPVLQVAEVAASETIGYSATYQAATTRLVATLAIGYADGIPRKFQESGCVYFSGNGETYAAPLCGRVSMDLLSCDVTNIPPAVVYEGAMGDLITAEHYVDEFAAHVGTIDYEVLTSLGMRLQRTIV